MGSVNVNRNVTDLFYRYKMPKIIAKVEGKGNGIKTVIVNMTEIAKAIGRPPTYPTKFFGCELGAQTQFDFKNDRFIVNGSHEAAKLQDLLDGFIKRYVLCAKCDNPETILKVSGKKQTIEQLCKACGHYAQLSCKHKLSTYILKNPPDLDPAAQGSSLTEGKRAKRTKKQQNESLNGDGRSSPNDEEDDVDGVIQVPDKISDNDEEDGEWSLDMSEDAIRARQRDIAEGAKGLTITEDLDKPEKERVDMFYEIVKHHLERETVNGKELVNEAERLDVRVKAPLILAELLFDEKIHLQVKKFRVLLLRFTHEDIKAQKYLLGGIEQVIALHRDVLMPKVSAILKLFYDADILEESVLLEWGSKISRKYVSRELNQEMHNVAEPFIKWLREAEEEDDSDAESEDDVEIEYDDRAKSTPLKVQPKVKPAATGEEDADDVDIDAI